MRLVNSLLPYFLILLQQAGYHDIGIAAGLESMIVDKLGGFRNASQVSDGAGAVLLMKRSLAMQKGLPILGVFRSFAAVGVDPAVMGVGPAAAIPVAAFASQYVYCVKKLELDPEKVNVNGGDIALGHPLGATGMDGTLEKHGSIMLEISR
ncbi:hypothetical protein ACFX15_034872 [Malus domestica]